VYDASAKLSSGILNGNVNQYGDFDQCLDVIAKNDNFRGKYCLANIQPEVSSGFEYLNYLRTLSLSFEAYKSEFKDVSDLKRLRICKALTIVYLLFSHIMSFQRLRKSIGHFVFLRLAASKKLKL
jgi:Nose resistant-to-fluoxetine protein, N-terminal domain